MDAGQWRVAASAGSAVSGVTGDRIIGAGHSAGLGSLPARCLADGGAAAGMAGAGRRLGWVAGVGNTKVVRTPERVREEVDVNHLKKDISFKIIL